MPMPMPKYHPPHTMKQSVARRGVSNILPCVKTLAATPRLVGLKEAPTAKAS